MNRIIPSLKKMIGTVYKIENDWNFYLDSVDDVAEDV